MPNKVVTVTALGVLAAEQERYPDSYAYFQTGIDLARQVSNLTTLGNLLNNIGQLDILFGDYEAAKSHLEESFAVLDAVNNKNFKATPLIHLGRLALAQNNIAQARRYIRQGGQLKVETGDQRGFTLVLEAMGALFAAEEHWEQAVQILGYAEALRTKIDVTISSFDRERHEELVATLHEHVEQSRFEQLWHDGAHFDLNTILAIIDLNPAPTESGV